MRAPQLLQLKRQNPEAYAREIERIERARLGDVPARRQISDEPIQRSDLDAGPPSAAVGVSAHKTDKRGVIERGVVDSDAAREIMDSALDTSADIHYAKHVAKTLALQGWRLDLFGLDSDSVDEAAQAEVETFAERACAMYGGGIQAMLDVALESVMRRGAVAPELDVADSLDDVLDVDFVPAERVDHQVVEENGHRTVRPVYVRRSGEEPIPFNPNQFAYFAFDATVGRPGGTPPFAPLVRALPPQTRLRDNLTRVVDNQGFSRLAFKLDLDKVSRSAPKEVVQVREDGTWVVQDFERYKSYLQKYREQVEELVEDMHADDGWVYYDLLDVGSVGANHANQSFKPGEIAQVFDQDTIAAALGQPAIHGRNWGAALSTTGDVQWMVYAESLEGMRRVPKAAVEWVLNQYMRIRGIRARAEITFDPLRKSDVVQDATAEEIRTRTILAQVGAGLIDRDEAAQMLVGHDATGEVAFDGDVSQGRSGLRAADGTGHDGAGRGADCECGACREARVLADDRAEPFEPDDVDTLDYIELIQDADPDETDAETVARRFDAWAEREAPQWVGLLRAEVVGDVAEERGVSARVLGQRATGDTWVWDSDDACYRYPSQSRAKGRKVPWKRVARLRDERIEDMRREAERVTGKLIDGELTIREWERRVAEQVKLAHLEARMLGGGGKNNMTPQDYGSVGGILRREYQYLADFSAEIARGGQSPSKIEWRTGLYFEAAVRDSYTRGSRYHHRAARFDQERNHLEPGAAHCDGCVAETDKGWRPVGTLVAIGERDCMANCKCWIEFRRGVESRAGKRGGDDGERLAAMPRLQAQRAVQTARSRVAGRAKNEAGRRAGHERRVVRDRPHRAAQAGRAGRAR